MKIVSENPPLVIEFYRWPGRVKKSERFLNFQLKLTVSDIRVFSLKISVYCNPFDFETYLTILGFGVEIANCE